MLRTVTCSPSNLLRPMACTLYISLKSGGSTARASHGDAAILAICFAQWHAHSTSH